MSYQLRILPRAEEDFLALVGWIRDRSVTGVAAWLAAYEQTLLRIQESPFRFERAQEAAELNRDLRQALFHTRRGRRYRIVFTVVDDTVYLLRIRTPRTSSTL